MVCTRRSLVASAALMFVYVLAAPLPAFSEPDARGEAETAALAAAQKEYEEAQTQLRAIGQQLEDTQLAKGETEAQLEELKLDIGETREGIATTTNELDTAQAALAAYLQISYKAGNLSLLDVLLSAVDFNDFVTRSYYATAIQDSQVETINEIKELKSRLERQEQVLSNQETEQARLLERLDRQEQKLIEQKGQADAVVAGLSTEVQQLFAAQQAELTAAAEARAVAMAGAAGAEQAGIYSPSVSQGSIVENAYACLGIPYAWGGDDSNIGTAEYPGYDCSGFVQHCYALEGYSIGRTTWDQIDEIQALGNWKTTVEELVPGDLVFPNDGHVGIYIGNNQMIDAPYPGMFIRIDNLEEFIGGGSPV